MFGLSDGDRYRKYQSLFLDATRKNKALAQQVKDLQSEVEKLKSQISSLENSKSTARKKKASTRTKKVIAQPTATAETEVIVEPQEKSDDTDTNSTE